MASDYLDPEAAKKIAKTLKLIPSFPWDEEALEETAADLARWCTGAIIDNRVWPAEAQARAIVEEARLTWPKWQGTAALYAIYCVLFPPAPKPPRYPVFEGYEKPPIKCGTCKDTGIVKDDRGVRAYCDCDMGACLSGDPELGERWLAILNGHARRGPAREARESLAGDSEADFRQHQQRVAKQISDAELVLADELATNERKEIAREVIRTFAMPFYRGESKKKKGKGKMPWQI